MQLTKKGMQMSDAQTNSVDRAAEITLHLLNELFRIVNSPNVTIRLWDGTRSPDDEPRPATLVLNHPGTLHSMLLPGTEVGLGEAYLNKDFYIEGNLEFVFSLADELAQDVNGILQKLPAARSLLQLPTRPERKLGWRGLCRLRRVSGCPERPTHHSKSIRIDFGSWRRRGFHGEDPGNCQYPHVPAGRQSHRAGQIDHRPG